MIKRTIKQVSELLHVSEHTLRFYEKERLIVPERGANGYRIYDEEAVLLLKYIIAMRYCGFTIPEIRSVIKYFYDGYTAEVVQKIAALLEEKKEWVAGMQAHYNSIAAVINEAEQQLSHASSSDIEAAFDEIVDQIIQDAQGPEHSNEFDDIL
ncbi:MerR family transcriptional regulator [Culicoidibacter larvae]|uniref:MerR family transcriptional regulator n=1 Tax=Culicoidibacter larvae TaxID=2579976 RepID=A0A5R8Q8S8_9FIRM|nr:MerR family transcriptional regulator [Culicoidibacter larvae]TLG71214.1 MerR family transcriptional regulator [Culicoidibacter larvae]